MIPALSKFKRAIRTAVIAAGTAMIALTSATLPAQAQFNTSQKAEIGKIVKEYLLKNPEVLRDALVELQRFNRAEEKAKRQQAIAGLSSKLHSSKHQVVLGNPEGKIQLVEFFDYNCGYCRRATKDMEKLIAKNSDLRVVLKEFPVLGPPSRQAAVVASALQKQFDGNQYWDFHRRLMFMRGRVGQAQALAAARASGADMARLTADMKSKDVEEGLLEVGAIAEALNMTGTPSYVVGPDVVVGAVGFARLQRRIDNIRKCGKSKCS